MEQLPDLQPSRSYVRERYGRQIAFGGETAFRHAVRVAEVVKRLATTVYCNAHGTGLKVDVSRHLNAEASLKVVQLQQAALLHEAIERSDTIYEQVRAVADAYVADLVAGLTRDMRLAEEFRAISYRVVLQEATQELQLVALADMICTAQTAKNWFESEDSTDVDVAVFRRIESLQEDLTAMSHISDHAVLRRYAESLGEGLTKLSQAVATRHSARARHSRLLKNIVANKDNRRGKRPPGPARKQVRRKQGS